MPQMRLLHRTEGKLATASFQQRELWYLQREQINKCIGGRGLTRVTLLN